MRLTYLKWVGNKTKLLHLIRPLFPKEFNDYFEPFMGSGAIFFYTVLDDESLDKTRSYHLVDDNEYLINCHQVVANRLTSLKEKLRSYKESDGAEFFKLVREKATGLQRGWDVDAAARFIYLNRRAYGGMWRVNRKGQFNVPFDAGQSSSLLQGSLRTCSKLLSKAHIHTGNYSIIRPAKGDFVFIDPPYYPLSATSNFTGYTEDVWREQNHEKLMWYLQKLDSSGVKFLMTNNDCDFIRSRCKGFNQKSHKVKRYIDAMTHHSKEGSTTKKKRDVVSEYFVWNYDERG